jgi:FkbM family methyltransferase
MMSHDVGWKQKVKQGLNRLGLDVTRYPPPPVLPSSLQELTLAVLTRYDVDLVVDVGANVGQYASGLRLAGYTGTIVSIEPVRDVASALSSRAEDDDNWHVHQLALGAQEGVLTINVPADTSVASFLVTQAWQNARHPGGVPVRSEPVQVFTLDAQADVLMGDARRVLLKLDTQGFDLDVLRGASMALERVVAIQTELSVLPIYEGMTGYLDAIPELTALGFTPAGFFNVDMDDRLRVIELDGLFVRA